MYCFVLCSRQVSLKYVLNSALWCTLRFPHKNDDRFVFTSSFFFIGEPMSYIRYLCGVFFVFVFVFFFCVIAYIGVQHIFGCVFVFVFLRLGYPISTGSLDCPFLIATLVFSNVYFLLTDNWPISFSFKHYCKWMKHTSYATQQVIYVSLDN